MELCQRVALSRDLLEHQLKAGDVATLVDFVSHSIGGEDKCILEVFSATEELIAVAVVQVSNIKSLKNDEVLAVCSLIGAS